MTTDDSELRRIDAFVRKCVPDLEVGAIKNMLGYGPFHYKYASGGGGDWFKMPCAE